MQYGIPITRSEYRRHFNIDPPPDAAGFALADPFGNVYATYVFIDEPALTEGDRRDIAELERMLTL